jgi:iron complex transport system ATP-binding protein
MSPVLKAHELTKRFSGIVALDGVSIEVEQGERVGLIGPNGAGKTTLFRSLLGFLPLRGGRVRLAGRDLADWGRRELAQTVAYVPQAHTSPFPFTVTEVVLMGRTPHLGVAGSPGRGDLAVAEENMERLGIAQLADRSFSRISGGERQLVLIARALTQQPALLMMDEPTSNLDLGNQVRVLRQVRQLAAAGLGIVMISHTPDHAFSVATTAALLRRDGTLRVGPPEHVVTQADLAAAYGEDVLIVTSTAPDGSPVRSCVPLL